MKRLRVALVEDRPEVMDQLSVHLAEDGRLELVGKFGSACQALREWPRCRPDVALVRWALGGAGAAALVREVNSGWGSPVVVATEREREEVEREALQAGAVSVFRTVGAAADFAPSLAASLLAMSRVRVLRLNRVRPLPSQVRLLAIACSTGGPTVLLEVLRSLECGQDFPVPLVLLQHIGSDFAESFREWLGRESGWIVEWAKAYETPRPGRIYLAPPERHLLLRENRFVLMPCSVRPGACPSATLFFSSVAEDLGPAAVGVVMTGMGDDGAEGLLKMRLAGAYTLVQDEASCAVFGMPAAALELQAALEQLSPARIGTRVREIVLDGRENSHHG